MAEPTPQPLPKPDPGDPPKPRTGNLISDRLYKVMQNQESGSAPLPTLPQGLPPRRDEPAFVVPVWAMALVGGILAGGLLVWALQPDPTPLATAVPTAAPAASPTPDAARALQQLMQATPERTTPPGALPSALPWQGSHTADTKTRKLLMKELERQGVDIGRFDPFAKLHLKPSARPSPKPKVTPLLFIAKPTPLPTPPPRFEHTQLRVVGVVAGGKLVALVEGTRDGRPFKLRVRAGEALWDDVVVQQLDLKAMKIQSPHVRLTLPIGQTKMVRRQLHADESGR